jgi:Type II restriction endonuclease, TdeIII
MLMKLQQELIALETINVLYRQLNEIREAVNPHHFEVYSNTFFDSLSDDWLEGISLRNWMSGLKTNLGQSFLENVANLLCDGTKKEFTSTLEDLEDATDFIADVFFEDTDQVVCVELKTVKPNKSVFELEKQKILEAEAALRRAYPKKKVKFFIGFPFDPLSTKPTGYNKQRFMDYSVDFRKHFSERDFLLSAELWDYLSGTTQTMEIILEIINTIATVDFMENFDFLQQKENATQRKDEYINLLKKWFLFREIILVQNSETIRLRISGDKRAVRLFNQNLMWDSF